MDGISIYTIFSREDVIVGPPVAPPPPLSSPLRRRVTLYKRRLVWRATGPLFLRINPSESSKNSIVKGMQPTIQYNVVALYTHA